MKSKVILIFLFISLVIAAWGILITFQVSSSIEYTILGITLISWIELAVIREAKKKFDN